MTWSDGQFAPLIVESDVGAWLTEAARSIDTESSVTRARPIVAAAWADAALGLAASHRAAGARTTGDRASSRQPLAACGRRARALLRPLLGGAVALAITAGGVAASTTPGAPLYGTRLIVERALLPSRGSVDRAIADLDYADRRLAEASEAVARGDRPAAAAALHALTDSLLTVAGEGAGAEPEVLRRHIVQIEVALSRLRSGPDDGVVDAAIGAARFALATVEPPPHGRRPPRRPNDRFLPETRLRR